MNEGISDKEMRDLVLSWMEKRKDELRTYIVLSRTIQCQADHDALEVRMSDIEFDLMFSLNAEASL